MGDYNQNWTNRGSEIQDDQPISADHIRALYDMLGSNPQSTWATLEERLGATGGTPPSTVDMPGVPAGYTEYWSDDFDNDTSWRKTGGGYFGPYVMRQGSSSGPGTRSYNLAANVYAESGMLRLRSKAEDTNGVQYSSAYVGTRESLGTVGEDQSYFPLFGRYQFMVKYPITHGHWNAIWLDYRGSASKFEIDLAEMFTAQTPGKVSMVTHRDPSLAGDYGWNMLNGSKGTTTWHIPAGPAGYSGTPAATHYGKAVDFDDPFGTDANQQSDWHLVEVEIVKVNGAAGGWTVDIEFYIDDVKVVTWSDTTFDYNATNATPAWYEPGHDNFAGDNAYSWDIRIDSWIGGNDIGEVESSLTVGGGTRTLIYDGQNGQGSTQYMRPVGEVPDMTLWDDDINAEYFLDVGWIRVLTNDSTGVTPQVPDKLWEFDGTGADEADVATGSMVGNDFTNLYKSGTGAPTIKYDTAQFKTGSESVRLQRAAGEGGCNAQVRFGAEYSPVWMRCAFRVDAIPDQHMYIMFAKDDPNGTNVTCAHIRLRTNGTLELSDGTTTVYTTTVIAADTWYQIDWGINAGVDTHELRLWNGDGDTLLEEVSAAYASVAPEGVFFAAEGTNPTAVTQTIWFDAMAIDDQDFIGPYTG